MVDKTCGLIAGCPEMVPSVVQTYPYMVYVTLFCWIINQCLVLTRCWKVLWCQSNRTIIHLFKNKNVGHLNSTIYLITIKHILKCYIQARPGSSYVRWGNKSHLSVWCNLLNQSAGGFIMAGLSEVATGNSALHPGQGWCSQIATAKFM